MAHKLSNLLVTALTVATGVVGHGHVNNIVIDGVYYEGYDPTSFPYETNPPIVVGWTAADTDNGFVAPDAYQSPDIICHKNATNAGGHASVTAGASILIQWVPYPWPHPGPILDYLANCNGPCETVDKTTLEFFKIDGIGLISGADPGNWAQNVLVTNNDTWVVKIPDDLASGNYVLRHELIALHSAESVDGAQNYPQCFNLAVTGTGSLQPTGILATDLYKETDPGILINIYTSSIAYTMPGPALVSGLPSSVAQGSSTATATSSATVPGGSVSSVKSSSTPSGPTSTARTTTKASSSSAATTPPPSGGQTQTLYGQCGGSGYSGPTKCASPAVCTTLNPYYAQCVDA
ncbi:glycoside hydrolase family 61 protein [Trichoderma chlorosporum]